MAAASHFRVALLIAALGVGLSNGPIWAATAQGLRAETASTPSEVAAIRTEMAARNLLSREFEQIRPLRMTYSVAPKYPRPRSGRPEDVLLPNSREYVVSPVPVDRAATLKERDLTHTVIIESGLAPPLAQWTGGLEITPRGGGSAMVSAFHAGRATVQLPEGEYTVRGRVIGRSSANPSIAFDSSMSMSVTSIVIAALGDSYSSGEGSPSMRVEPYPAWWDDQAERALKAGVSPWKLWGIGVAPVWSLTSRRSNATDDLPVEAVTVSGAARLPWKLQGLRIKTTDLEPHEEDNFLAHRSPFAPGSQLAMAIEEASDASSVTFINLAVSGATIPDGIEQPANIPDYAGRFALPQIDELAELVKGRKIDILLLGFGGNDAGFAPLAEALVRRERGAGERIGPSYETIENAIRTGDWSFQGDRPRQGLDTIGQRYRSMKQIISERLAAKGVTVVQTYLIGYPNPLKKTSTKGIDANCSSPTIGSAGEYCEFLRNVANELGLPSFLEFEVNERESQWADKHFLSVLTSEMCRAANEHGWKFVDMNRGRFASFHATAGKPYRRDVDRRGGFRPPMPPLPPLGRAVRAGRESFAITSSYTKNFEDGLGLLHMNEWGYQEMARQIGLAIVDEQRDIPLMIATAQPVATEVLLIPGERRGQFQMKVQNGGTVPLTRYDFNLRLPPGLSVQKEPTFGPVAPGGERVLTWTFEVVNDGVRSVGLELKGNAIDTSSHRIRIRTENTLLKDAPKNPEERKG